MNWTIEEIPELRGYCVEWAEPGNFYFSRRNVIYRSADLKAPFERVATIDAPIWKTVTSKFRLAQRLLRFMATSVVPLNDGSLFVTFDKSVGVVRDGEYRPLDGLVRPCRVLRAACAVDENGSVFFGEYLANTERGPMRIYRYRTGEDRVEVVHTFPPGSIRHIHGVYYDKYTRSMFCLTGDHENECRILRSDDEFKTVETVGGGDETWRAVSMLFAEKSIFYGTDAEFRDNNIFELDRKTGQRKDLGTVNGTVFYSKQVGDDMFFTTTAENAPSQAENVAALWLLQRPAREQGRNTQDETSPTHIAKFKKDLWHPSLFQFGTIHFPYLNALEDQLYFHLVGVQGDNRTFRIRAETRA